MHYVRAIECYNAFTLPTDDFMSDTTIQPLYPFHAPNRSVKAGRPKQSRNLHSKQPSSIARRLKFAGLDWVADMARAIKADDKERIALWMRLLPYLVVTQGHRRIKKPKGRASKAAVEALEDLEGRL